MAESLRHPTRNRNIPGSNPARFFLSTFSFSSSCFLLSLAVPSHSPCRHRLHIFTHLSHSVILVPLHHHTGHTPTGPPSPPTPLFADHLHPTSATFTDQPRIWGTYWGFFHRNSNILTWRIWGLINDIRHVGCKAATISGMSTVNGACYLLRLTYMILYESNRWRKHDPIVWPCPQPGGDLVRLLRGCM